MTEVLVLVDRDACIAKYDFKKSLEKFFLCAICSKFSIEYKLEIEKEKLKIALMRGYKFLLREYFKLNYFPICDNCYRVNRSHTLCFECGAKKQTEGLRFYKCKKCNVRLCRHDMANQYICQNDDTMYVLNVDAIVEDIKQLSWNVLEKIDFRTFQGTANCIWCHRRTCNSCSIFVPLGSSFYTFVCKLCYDNVSNSITYLFNQFNGTRVQNYEVKKNVMLVGMKEYDRRLDKYVLKKSFANEIEESVIQCGEYTWFFTANKRISDYKNNYGLNKNCKVYSSSVNVFEE